MCTALFLARGSDAEARPALGRVVDHVLGPVIISALLFFAVLSNFIIRGETNQQSGPLSRSHSNVVPACDDSHPVVREL